ncbi:MAG: hypothetical protein ACRC5C_13155 [Bacilli bacterium]
MRRFKYCYDSNNAGFCVQELEDCLVPILKEETHIEVLIESKSLEVHEAFQILEMNIMLENLTNRVATRLGWPITHVKEGLLGQTYYLNALKEEERIVHYFLNIYDEEEI